VAWTAVGIERCSASESGACGSGSICRSRLRIEADLRTGGGRFCAAPFTRACGVAADAWTGHGRDSNACENTGWRYVLRDRVEIHGAAWHSGYAAFPMGAEAGSHISLWTSLVVRRFARSGRGPRQRCPQARSPRRLLDSLWKRPGGRDCRLELGDEFGWSPTPIAEVCSRGSGQSQFHQFRDRLLNLGAFAATADYKRCSEKLAAVSARAYLVFWRIDGALGFGFAAPRSWARARCMRLLTSICQLTRGPHFHRAENPAGQDVYAALEVKRKPASRRVGAATAQLECSSGLFLQRCSLRTAVEG